MFAGFFVLPLLPQDGILWYRKSLSLKPDAEIKVVNGYNPLILPVLN